MASVFSNEKSDLDIYWENVGGETLDAVLLKANNFARIIACGMISQYGNDNPYGVKNLSLIVGKRIRMEGFIQSDFRGKYHAVCYFTSLLTPGLPQRSGTISRRGKNNI
jgi:NADPH-dependent curcumin reductase CurA